MPGNIITITPEDIASWPTPNYINPITRTWLPAYSLTLHVASTLMVVIRLWLRAGKKAGGLGLDDVLLVGAWFSAGMMTASEVAGALKYDIGRHVWDVPTAQFEKVALVAWLVEFFFLISGACTKISVLLFYRRLADGTYRRLWKWAIIGAILFTATWSLAFILTLIFNCTPTEAYWKAFNPTYHHKYTCTTTKSINLMAGIFAAVSDVYTIVLPCVLTRRILMPKSQKIALYFLFCVGGLGVAASAFRTYYLYEVGQKSDVSWLMYDVFVFAHLETEIGIMCAAAPSLRVFIRDYMCAPFSRAVHTRSATPRQPDCESPISSDAIRRIRGHNDCCERNDFTTKYTRTSAENTAHEVEEADSPSSTAPSSHYLIKTPEHYEAYHLQNMERVEYPSDYTRGRAL